MAAADIVQMPFGYVVGGTGIDDTEVFANKKRIKMISFSGNADTATCALTSKNHKASYVSCGKFMSNDTNELNSASGNHMWFGERGSTFWGLKVNLSNTGDHCYIHTA